MKKIFITITAICLAAGYANAQFGGLDLSFDPGTGANGVIRTVALQADSKILVGGDFTSFDGIPAGHLARLYSNGKVDTSFNIGSGTNDGVYNLAVQADGKIIAVGNFTTFNGSAHNYIVRLNADGSVDQNFNTGTGPNNYTRAVLVQPDKKIVVGGAFTNWNGTTAGRLIRLDSTGAVDPGFNTTNGANGDIGAVAIQPFDGKILIGGDFTTYNGTPPFRISRINTDGSRDATFSTSLGAGASKSVRTFIVLSNQSIIIGGAFTKFNTNGLTAFDRYCIAELGPAGDLQAYAGPPNGWTGTSTLEVNTSALLPNSEAFFGGGFTYINGTPEPYVVALDGLGTVDPAFNAGVGPDQGLYCSVVQPNDGKIIIGGVFTTYSGISRNRVARLYSCNTPQPGAITGSNLAHCPGTILTYSIAAVSGASQYIWTLPSGWTGTSDSTSITVVSNGQGGLVSVVAFDSTCGYSPPRNLSISNPRPPSVQLCIVTVDSQSVHNIIYWNKPATDLIDSFFIYREVTTNVYTKIAAIPYDSLSEYIDTDTAANPNAQSFLYKIVTVDTCGVATDTSPYHSTIFVPTPNQGNVIWTKYGIEGTSYDSVLSYNIYRDNQGTGVFVPIGLVAGNASAQFQDVNYQAFPDAEYVVDVNWGGSTCVPTRAVNTSRSNIRHNSLQITDVQALNEDALHVYPNPANGSITLGFAQDIKIKGIEIDNLLMQTVYHETAETGTWATGRKHIDISQLTKGVYTLRVETDYGRFVKKLVVN